MYVYKNQLVYRFCGNSKMIYLHQNIGVVRERKREEERGRESKIEEKNEQR